MKQIKVEKEINVFYIEAKSFPEGVMEAFQKMHSLIEFPPQRRNFGISKPGNGRMTYRVASEELIKGDLEKHGLAKFTIPAGNYIGIALQDFRKDLSNIQKTFQSLLSEPNVDPDGYCVEEYVGMNDVVCMVKLND